MTRLVGIDRLRGIAIIAMIVDHVATVTSVEPLRYTIGRLAMPLFFIVAGSLVGNRVTWKHGLVFLIGIGLPFVVPFVESPNVLTLYAIGAVIIVYVNRWAKNRTTGLLVVMVVALTLSANKFDAIGSGYLIGTLIGLMCVGGIAKRESFDVFGLKIPKLPLVDFVGRHPLVIYVGHSLLIVAIVQIVG